MNLDEKLNFLSFSIGVFLLEHSGNAGESIFQHEKVAAFLG